VDRAARLAAVSERPTTSTRSAWRAAWLLAHNLPLIVARRLPGSETTIEFCFDDPGEKAPQLIEALEASDEIRRLIDSRWAISRAIDVVQARGRCVPADVADAIERIGAPWRTPWRSRR
jgi:uncharacterized protein YaiL (DUF2058 family)